MLNNPAAKEYARALFEMASERESVEAVEEQLKAFVEACKENAGLGVLFYHPQIPLPAKRDVVQKLFATVLADFVGKFLLLLIDKRRETLLPAILEEYGQLTDELRNICRVEVTTAMPLNDVQKQSFIAKLSGITGRNVELLTAVDKKLLGGAVLQIGDRRIDGSVLSHLDRLKAVLLKKEATGIEVTS
jgi:F-type H+-transporting ATPase subunit delta